MNFLAATVEIPDIDIVGIAAIITALTVIFFGARAVNRTLRNANKFFEDWYGDKETGKGGVVHRLYILETSQQEIKSEISEIRGTVQSQLNKNGGGSMADIAAKSFKAIEEMQLQIEQEVLARKDWQEQYAKDQAFTRYEWIQVFSTIAEMIPKEPHEQLEIWNKIAKKYTHGEL
jgi:hypothetical protein